MSASRTLATDPLPARMTSIVAAATGLAVAAALGLAFLVAGLAAVLL